MGHNRDLALNHCQPSIELPFSLKEYNDRLRKIKDRMITEKIDLLWLSAPESLFYVSGYTCEWYQSQSPKKWPPTSGIAINVNSEDFILFDTPSEQIMCRFVTCSNDTRIFPIGERRDGIPFIMDELKSQGWLKGNVGIELQSYRPNPNVSERFRSAFEDEGCNVVDGSDILRDIRWVKSPKEVEYIEKAAELTDIGLQAAKNTIRPGVTELEVWGEIMGAMGRAGGENPSITLPVLSGLKANTGHSLSSRKKIKLGEQVNVDVSGVFNRYHCNAARSFYLGEPPKDVLKFYSKAVGVFEIIEKMLKPNLAVGKLVTECKEYYNNVGIFSDACWVGGYELGLAFPPDWVGNFVYEMFDDKSQKIFEPGTVVNYESQFFGPRLTGITYTICTLLFKKDRAFFPVKTPRQLIILDN